MKKIKIFPAPNVEIRIHVTEEMEKDMRECGEIAACDDVKDGRKCKNCSWHNVEFGDTGMCQLDEVIRRVLGGAE